MPLLTPEETAERIRMLREERGWEALDLAGRAGVEAAALTAFERGEASLPSQILIRVAAALGVSPDQFLRSEDVSTAPLFRRSESDDSGAEATERADRLIDDFFALEALTRR